MIISFSYSQQSVIPNKNELTEVAISSLLNKKVFKHKIELTDEEKEFLRNNTFNIRTINWEPFYTNENEQGIGFDLWRNIALELNIKYRTTPEKTAYDMFENMKTDPHGVVLSTTFTEDRGKASAFTNEYVSFPLAVATNVNENYIFDFTQLEGKKIAIGEDYSAHRLMEVNYPDIELVHVKNTDEALKLLAKGKVDGAIDILPVLIYKMNRYAYPNIKLSGTSRFRFDVQMMVNKNSKELISILNKAFEAIDKKELSNIINKWVVKSQTIEKIDYKLFIQIFVPLLIIMFILIITSIIQKRKNITIQSLKSKYQNFIKYSSEGIFIIDPYNGELVEYSDTVKKLLGYDDKELSKLYVYDWDKNIHTVKEFTELVANVGYDPVEFQRTHVRKDGSTYEAAITVTRINIENEQYIYSSVRDISERIELRKIKQLKDELIETQDIAKIGVSILRDANNLNMSMECNHIFYEILEYDYDKEITKNMLISSIDDNDFLRYLETMKEYEEKGSAYIRSLKVKTGKGNTKYVNITWKLKKELDKEPYLFNIITDVSDRILQEKEVEQQKIMLMQQQRLAQQGEMLEMIGHQWRQPLNSVAVNIQVVQMLIDENDMEKAKERLSISLNTITYLSKTIDDFKSFFENRKAIREFDIVKVINNSLKIVQNRIDGNDIKIKKNYTQDDLFVNSFKSELGQVLLVVLNNSIDELKSEDLVKTITINLEEKDSDIMIKIQDNAGGIPEKNLPYIFDAYYSTKDKKHGTGLGLYMSKMIAEKLLKGSINAYNFEDGAVFEIVIPKNLNEL